MEIRRACLSLHPLIQNAQCIDWGPNGYLGIAYEHFVSIYQQTDKELVLIRTIAKHRSNITCIKFSTSTVEIEDPNAFQLYLGVGDESGNFIAYDVFTGERHAGISAEKVGMFRILSIRWHPMQTSTVYVLTSLPSVICVKCGARTCRRNSSAALVTESRASMQIVNARISSAILQKKFEFMDIDPFNPCNIFLWNCDGTCGILKDNGTFSVLPRINLQEMEKVINLEYFPHAPNKLVIILKSKLLLYDLVKKTMSPILTDIGSSFYYSSNLFPCSRPGQLWVPLTNGTVDMLTLVNDEWDVQSQIVCLGGIQKANQFIADSYNPARAAVVDKDGTVIILQEKRNKMFITATIPAYKDSIVKWTAENEKIAFVTNLGFIGVWLNDDTLLRFRIEDDHFDTIRFCGMKLLVGAKRLHEIDLVTRRVVRKGNILNPRRLTSNGLSIAYTPSPNILDVIDHHGQHKTVTFTGNIAAFSPKINDPHKWVVVVPNVGLCVVTTGGPKLQQLRYKMNEEHAFVTSVVFFDEKIVTADQNGDLQVLRTDTLISTTHRIYTCPIQSMRYNQDRLLVITEECSCFIMDANSLQITGQVKLRLIDAHFYSNDHIVIQTSNSSLRILGTNFEPISVTWPVETTAKARFINSKSVDEMDAIALEVGDKCFTQFIRSVQKKDGIPIPSLYSLSRSDYIQKDRLVSLIEKNTCRDNYIEYLILTKREEQAAKLLLESGTKDDLLFAYACLTPNATIAKQLLAEQPTYTSLISRIMVMGGDTSGAVETLLEDGKTTTAFRFMRFLQGDNEYRSLVANWIEKEPHLLKCSVLRADIGDSAGVLALLKEEKRVSRARAYLLLKEETDTEIEQKWNTLLNIH